MKCKEIKKNKKIGTILKEKKSPLCWYWVRKTTAIGKNKSPKLMVTTNEPKVKNRINNIQNNEKETLKIKKIQEPRIMKLKESSSSKHSSSQKQKNKLRIKIPKWLNKKK